MKFHLTTLARFFIYSGVLFALMALALIYISGRVIHDSFIYQTTLSVATNIQQASYKLRAEDFSSTDSEQHREVFGQTWQEIRTNEFVRIKVWDNDARIIYSDDDTLIGQRFPDNEHYLQAMQGDAVSEVGEAGVGENISEAAYSQLLEVYVPVTFDDTAGPVGVVEAYVRLDAINTQIAQTQRIVALTIGAFTLATFVLLFIFFNRVVFQPVSELKDAAQAIERGDLKRRVRIKASDEIGLLASSFNSMAAKLESYYLNLEEKVRDRTLRLGVNEFRYRRLFETAQDGIVLLDAETGEVTDVNPFLEKLLGIDKSQLLGRPFWEIEAFAEGDLGRAAFRELQTKGVVTYTDKPIQTKSGKVFIELVGKAYSVSDKEFIQCNIRDVTERRKSEDRKRELDELKSNFIKIISHQLRTPLGAVRWNVEEMLSGSMGQLPQGQADVLQVINKANKEIIDRINDMITALDIEEGRISLEKSATPLESLVQSIVGELRGSFDAKKVALNVDLPSAPLPQVEIDPSRIRDVVAKLTDNALTYTPEGGRVAIKVSRVGNRARFEITDSGKGIPQVEQARIFQRFYRASNAYTMKSDSSGLGLFIAKHFVESHQGIIGFESKEGEGTRFWFELPL